MRCLVAALGFLQTTASIAAATQSNAEARNAFIKAMTKAAAEEASQNVDMPMTREERKARLNKHLLANSFRSPVSRNTDDFGRQLDGYDDSATFDFDAPNYSLKYTGCTNLAGYSDDLAQQQGYNVLMSKNYVSFRLCPSDTCSDSSRNGCTYNYGEYLIPMDDYLQAISQYRQEDFQLYCSYCEQCMYFENYFYGHRELGDHACKYYDSCYNYTDVCTANDDDGGGYYYPTAYEAFMTCQQVGSSQSGKAYYVGPYCGNDHKTITIGLFSDQFCTDYIGTSESVAKVTSVDIDDDALSELYSGSCISCSESTSPYKVQANKNADDISEICSTVYAVSAKCEKNILQETTYVDETEVAYQSKYKLSYAQKTQQTKTCSYIEKAAKHQYDKYGVVHLDGENDKIYVHDSSAIGKMNRIIYDMNHASGGQKAAITVLALGCAGLVAAAVVIYKKIHAAQPALAFQEPDPIEASRGGLFAPQGASADATGEDDILATRSSGTETWA